MKTTMLCVLAGMLIGLAGSSLIGAADKEGASNAEKLLGKWSIVKVNGKEAEKKGSEVIVEFLKDGKMTMTMSAGGKDEKEEGTYKVEGDKIIAQQKGKEKKDTMLIKKLTADALVVYDETDKEEIELKKK